jgi:osmotically-inducible protein OsmY
VDEEQMKVEVTNGTAHLMGTVDSWSEHEAAADNAYEAGAVAVDNDLMIATQ